MTTLKFDPVNQCSEASLLKDLTNLDTQQKFNKTNLNEVKIAFYNRTNKSSNVRTSGFNPLVDDNTQEIAEDIDYQDDNQGFDDEEDDYCDRDFAQSMPAQYLAGMTH